MANAFDHENTPFGSYGEFEGYDQTADWTEQDWQDYDAHVSAEIADFEARQGEEDFFWPSPEDFNAPF